MAKFKEFRKAIEEKILIFDGAMGTILQSKGLLQKGKPPELINLEHPETIREIHKNYILAGSDIVETNTFGANPLKLDEYGIRGKLKEVIASAVRMAKGAVKKHYFVAGSIGPSGKFLLPVGDLSFEDAVENFRPVVEVFLNEGVDLFNLETFMDTKELRAAVVAIRELSEDVPIIAMMTFQQDLRTVLGTSPEAAGVLLQSLPVDVIGANCSLGPEGIIEVLKRMSPFTNKPMIFQPNAGLPVVKQGITYYPATPEDLSSHTEEAVGIGARILAGCCGTTPEHINALKVTIKNLNVDLSDRAMKSSYKTALSSRTGISEYGKDKCIIVGERINPSGKKKLTEALKKGDISIIRKEARIQTQKGADVLDVNVSIPDGDEKTLIRRAVFAAEASSDLPLCIDSSDTECLEEGVKNFAGKPVLNSASCEMDKLEKVLRIAKLYGASIVVLPIDEKGIPSTSEGRLKLIERAVKYLKKVNFPLEEVFFDPLVLTVSSDTRAPSETLKTLEGLEKMGLFSIMGLSNVSFGLPARDVLNSAFLSMALEKGLKAVILNPLDENLMTTFRGVNLLLGRDIGARNYLGKVKPEKGERVKVSASEDKAEDMLKQAIINGEKDNAVNLTQKLINDGWEPLKISNEVLVEALKVVGEKFASQEFFLPQVILSADAVKASFNVLRPIILKKSKRVGKKIIFATVEGDVHDIGKNIVITLLESNGFEVIDLGKNVKTEEIVKKTEQLKPDVVALSALMTTTMPAMKKVIEEFRSRGINVPVAVGGACVTEDYAKKIGAKVYADDALSAVEKFKKFLSV